MKTQIGTDIQLHLGDCLEVMKSMESNSCDSIVCDPPYALAFMGKAFDTFHENGVSDNVAFQRAMTPIFKEALRVAKPGAHLVAFGGTRTYHRLACAIEDTGWEVRDSLMWVCGQSMPKGLNIGKAIDKKLGCEREKKVIQVGRTSFGLINDDAFVPHKDVDGDEAVSEEAKRWEGWNSQLKPAYEPIVLARKPLDGNIVDNVLKWGVGGINIDGCRVPTDTPITIHSPARKTLLDSGHKDLGTWQETKGRYPADLIHDGSDEVLACFPNVGKSSGGGCHTKGKGDNKQGVAYGKFSNGDGPDKIGFGDSGSAARFFYCAKASRKERGEGNLHPTVKPLALMRWLVTLVSPKGSVVLDPFMGSGSTGIAALQCGCRFVGIEKDPYYYDIAERRIKGADAQEVEEESEGEEEPAQLTATTLISESPQPSLVQGELEL